MRRAAPALRTRAAPLVAALALVVAAGAGAQPPATAALTNADVVKLSKAGLGDAVISAAIRQATARAFDLSPDGLLALKKAGVSESVLAVMLAPASPPAPSSPPDAGSVTTAEGDDAIRSQPPGIYMARMVGGRTQLEPLEPTVFTQGKTGGLWASAMTGGLYRAKWKAVVRNPSAQIRVTDDPPTFYFHFASKGTDPGQSGSFAGWMASATSPNEFVLVQMYRTRNSRELVVGESNAFSTSAGTRSEDTVPFAIERLSPGIYRVIPTEKLGPGEFCFFYAVGAPALGGATLGKLFDFGVDRPR